MPANPTHSRVVVLDANVLFPLSLRDLLFRALEKGLYRLQISRHIWDEVIRNLVENGRMTPEGAAYLDMRVQEFLAENDALVSGYKAAPGIFASLAINNPISYTTMSDRRDAASAHCSGAGACDSRRSCVD